MIAGGEDIDAVIQQLPGGTRGQSEAAGYILAVTDNEFQLVLLAQAAQVLVDDLPARPADDITDG
jgi:hypothetical protein